MDPLVQNSPRWIFGYGSIIWKVNFPYTDRCVGHIKNYTRRFWQGSHDHRGTKDKPGRVVTLVPSKGDCTWGVAYHVDPNNWDMVINNLNNREIDGYISVLVKFYPEASTTTTPFDVWTYLATPDNESFLGDAPITTIAEQIIDCCGMSGSNSEYVTMLAESLRALGPNALDQHTSELEELIKRRKKSTEYC